jgi:hypothetical protein
MIVPSNHQPGSMPLEIPTTIPNPATKPSSVPSPVVPVRQPEKAPQTQGSSALTKNADDPRIAAHRSRRDGGRRDQHRQQPRPR